MLPSLEAPATAPWTVSETYEAAFEMVSTMEPVVVVLEAEDLSETCQSMWGGNKGEWD